MVTRGTHPLHEARRVLFQFTAVRRILYLFFGWIPFLKLEEKIPLLFPGIGEKQRYTKQFTADVVQARKDLIKDGGKEFGRHDILQTLLTHQDEQFSDRLTDEQVATESGVGCFDCFPRSLTYFLGLIDLPDGRLGNDRKQSNMDRLASPLQPLHPLHPPLRTRRRLPLPHIHHRRFRPLQIHSFAPRHFETTSLFGRGAEREFKDPAGCCDGVTEGSGPGSGARRAFDPEGDVNRDRDKLAAYQPAVVEKSGGLLA